MLTLISYYNLLPQYKFLVKIYTRQLGISNINNNNDNKKKNIVNSQNIIIASSFYLKMSLDLHLSVGNMLFVNKFL